jgi:hypothetical protein
VAVEQSVLVLVLTSSRSRSKLTNRLGNAFELVRGPQTSR